MALGARAGRCASPTCRALRLDNGALGLSLFAVAAGSLLAMPAVGGCAARRGSAPVTKALGVLFCAAMALPALASSVPLLILALLALGATNGGLDVAMNAQATAVERAWGAPVMSSFHALYSAGGLLGAAGGALAARHLAPAAHLGVVAGLLAATIAIASRHLLAAGADAQESGPFFRRPDRSLAILAALAFCVLVVEGAISDWSAVFMEQVTHAGPSLKAAGLAAFSLAMAAGRFAGDWATRRLGPVRLVRGGGLLAAAGLGAAVVTARPFVAVAGFACVGAGFAAMFPSLMRAAARRPRAPARASPRWPPSATAASSPARPSSGSCPGSRASGPGSASRSSRRRWSPLWRGQWGSRSGRTRPPGESAWARSQLGQAGAGCHGTRRQPYWLASLRPLTSRGWGLTCASTAR